MYAPAPTGGNIVVLSFGRSTGELLFDPSLPFDDVNAGINSGSLLYGRTFGLFGRSANAIVSLPYVWGDISGFVEDEFRQITRSSLGDVRGQLTVNILGGPALTPREFAAARPDTILGLSLVVAAPTGQYDPSKLINIGSNRWSLRPQVGVSKTVGPWYLELYGGVWFFGTNTDFFGGSVREQDPIGSFQAPELHLQAPPVAGGRRDVLHRWANDPGRQGECGRPEQLTPGGDPGPAPGAPSQPEGGLGHRLHHSDRRRFRHPWRGTADGLVRVAVTPLQRKTRVALAPLSCGGNRRGGPGVKKA